MSPKTVEKEITHLIDQMTVAEKVNMCHAVTKFSSGGVSRLGIPELTMSDGPHGVREEIAADSWDAVGGDADFATYLPTGTALAATWSKECARAFGEVLGAEARERCKDVILGPGVNMVRSPLCGRNFEYYSEDPYLAGSIGVASIKGIQTQGTAACVKHYALNSQELRRFDVNANCDERTLREIYLPAFEMTVKEGKVMTLMGAYNLFRGQKCCQHDYLLNQILKKEWGFDGVVISDWAGVTETFQAARNGMDIEMGTGRPYADYHLAGPFERAVNNGEIEEALLDDKVRRILRLMFKLGILGHAKRPKGARNTTKHQQTAAAIAEEAITLLKNEKNLLPLDAQKVKKLLVVGDNAKRKHHLGGHSSAVKALYEVSPLEGLEKLLQNTGVEISYFQGYPQSHTGGQAIPTKLLGIADAGAGTRGWICEIYDTHHRNTPPVLTMPAETVDFDYTKDLPESLKGKDFGVRYTAKFTPEKTELWNFFLDGTPQSCLVFDRENIIENCKSEENICGTAAVTLEAGKTYDVTVTINHHMHMPIFPVKLTAAIGELKNSKDGDKKLIAEAQKADAILFFGGLNHTFDAEGCDRKDMALHDGQNELIAKLAQINPKLAVILVGGSPMEMPWADQVPAIVQMWYSGMACGNAIAKILFGEVNPSGKLPFTFPVALADSPAHALHDYAPLNCNYAEGVLMGYRWFDTKKLPVLFSFGHGLSYTTFAYSDLKFKQLKDTIKVSVKVKNTGKVKGKEVVQLYVSPKNPEFVRPLQELKGFAKCELAPGKSKVVSFTLDFRSFAYYHPNEREWTVDAGLYQIRVGSGSRDIRLKQTVKIS